MKKRFLSYRVVASIFLLSAGLFAQAQTCNGCGKNLVTNSDFSAGNTGFGTTLTFSNVYPLSPGQYTIVNNATLANPGWIANDHTSPPTGLFMAVDGALTTNDAWTQSIPVQQNTNYTFCFWVTNLVKLGLNLTDPNMAATINGSTVAMSGSLPETNSNTTIWKLVTVNWNSGLNTTANLAIRPLVAASSGNDYGIDDISFVQTSPPTAIAGPDWTICMGGSRVLGFPPLSINLSYSWSPATGLNNSTIAQPTASPTATTTYTLTVTSPGGCTATDDVVISVSPPANAGPDRTICMGGSTLIGTPAVASTIYSWSPSTGLSTSIIAQPIAAPIVTTTYTLTTTSPMGCTSTDAVIVNVNPAPTIIASTTPACQGTATGSINISVSGATPPYTFAWSNGATTEDLNNIPVGSYTVTVTTAAGCSAVAVFNVITTVNCKECIGCGKNLVANGDFSAGNVGFTSGLAFSNIYPLFAGQYTIINNAQTANGNWRGRDHTSPPTGLFLAADGSTAFSNAWMQSIPVIQNTNYTFCFWVSNLDRVGLTLTPPNLAAVINGVLVAASGPLPVTNTNINTTWQLISVVWNSGTNTTANLAIRQLVNVSGGNDYGIDDISFIQTNPPVANAGPDKIICAGSGTLIGTPAVAGLTYSWTPATGLSSTSIAQPTASPLVSTQYILTVASSGNCMAMDTVNVTVNPKPTITASITPACQGTATGSININVTGGPVPYTFVWSNGATTEDLTAVAAGNYTVTVTSAAGCSAAAVFNVNISPNCGTCRGCGANLVKNGDFSAGNAGFTSALTFSNVYPLSAGKYTIVNNAILPNGNWRGTDHTNPPTGLFLAADGATALSNAWMQSIPVMQNTNYTFCFWVSNLDRVGLTLTLPNLAAVINGVQVAASGPLPVTNTNTSTTWQLVTVVWNSGTATTANLAIRQLVNVSGGNDYGIDDISFIQTMPTPANAGPDKIICAGSSTVIGTPVVPGLTYLWTPATGLSSTTVAQPTASPLVTTQYILTVTSTGKCVAKDTVKVTVNPRPAIIASTTPACPGATNGSINISVSGGSAPFTFVWSNGATTEDLTSIAAGSYTVTATNAAGCTTSAVFSVINSVNCGDCRGCGANLVKNGNFSAGNTGFTSGLVFSNVYPLSAGRYTITNNAQLPNGNWRGRDHTNPPTGLFLAADGAPAFSNAWMQSVPVMKNTDYTFCFWVSNLDRVGLTLTPANLAAVINGVQVAASGPLPVTNTNTSTTWQLVTVTWNSGAATTANLAIRQLVNVSGGNDYGIDDISFIQTTPTLANAGPDKTVCVDSSVVIGTPAVPGLTYSWAPAAGLNSTSIAQPTASPAATTQYVLTVKSSGNCVDTDTVLVTVKKCCDTISGTVDFSSFTPGGFINVGGMQYWTTATIYILNGLSNSVCKDFTHYDHTATFTPADVDSYGMIDVNALIPNYKPSCGFTHVWIVFSNSCSKATASDCIEECCKICGTLDPIQCDTAAVKIDWTCNNYPGVLTLRIREVYDTTYNISAPSVPGTTMTYGFSSYTAVGDLASFYPFQSNSWYEVYLEGFSSSCSEGGISRKWMYFKYLDCKNCMKAFSTDILGLPPKIDLASPSSPKTVALTSTVTGGVAPFTYQWTFSAGSFSATGTFSAPNSASTNFTVSTPNNGVDLVYVSLVVTDANGCTATINRQVLVSQGLLPIAPPKDLNVVKAKENSKSTTLAEEPAVTVYPNPNNGEFTVEWDHTSETHVRIQVYNVVGELVADKQVANESKYKVDISSTQPKGMYIVKVTIGSHTIMKKVTNQ